VGFQYNAGASIETIVVVCAVVCCSLEAAERNPDGEHRFAPTETERGVIDHISNGQEANLCPADCRPEKLTKHIGATFLEQALIGVIKFNMPGKPISITGAIIDGPIDLRGLEINSDVVLEHCRFEDKIDLAGSHFHKALRLNQSTFNGMLVLDDARIEGPFEAKGAHFINGAYFKEIRCNSGVSFKPVREPPTENDQRTRFDDEVCLDDARIELNFEAQFAQFKAATEISGAKFASNLLLDDATFSGSVWFDGSSVFNNFSVERITVTGSVQMRSASFGVLNVSGMRWPTSADKINISGMTYGQVYAGKQDVDTWHYLKSRFASFPYSVDNYEHLAEFFLKQGRPELADDVFIEQKAQERKQVFWRGIVSPESAMSQIESAIRWTWSWVLDVLVGYGRHPWQAIGPCAIVIFIGCKVFRREVMEPQKPMDSSRGYSPFWYSLNLFLPVVDLQSKGVWKPKQEFTFARNYLRVHVLLGWILVPIIVAALSGIIK